MCASVIQKHMPLYKQTYICICVCGRGKLLENQISNASGRTSANAITNNKISNMSTISNNKPLMNATNAQQVHVHTQILFQLHSLIYAHSDASPCMCVVSTHVSQ